MHDTQLLDEQPIAWTPTPDVIERAQLTKFMRQVGVSTWEELYEFSIRDVEKFTEEVLKFLDIKFDPPYEKLLDTSNGVEMPTWFGRSETPQRSGDTPVPMSDASSRTDSFGGGTADGDKSVAAPTGLNITEMCLDRWQTDEMKDQPAVIWEGEDGSSKTFTYSQLMDNFVGCVNILTDLGLKKGDAIGIHLPMLPETIIALLAINRIGAIAVPVFSGYGIDAIASRMIAVGAKALFTCVGTDRRGKSVDMMSVAAEVVASVPSIETVILVGSKLVSDLGVKGFVTETERLSKEVFSGKTVAHFKVNGDIFSLLDDHPSAVTAAEDPLIILYTSGTTGKPKGIAHTHASFPIKAAQDMAFGTDVGKGTRISWYTDIGWMMGPWLIYGALINGATICIYDGAPDYPTPDRMWEFCAKHKVEVLGISPTLIRSLAAAERSGDTHVRMSVASTRTSSDKSESSIGSDIFGGGTADGDKSVAAPVRSPFERHDLSSLRIFASTGEPWNPEPWWWLFEKVGNSKLPIINYSGGTEIAGGILMGNPLLPIKPCSFPAPCPGMDVDILDEDGNHVENGKVGELVIKQPWIGMARGFWQEKERYLDTYWRRFKDIWVHGDFAMRDKDGHWFILGRSDDTLKVAGKRVGPAEVESLLVAHPLVIEAAVIGVPDDVKGTAMVAFVVRSGDTPVPISAKHEPIIKERRGWSRTGNLPHFDGEVTQFITFRLADSLPKSVLEQYRLQIEHNKLPDSSEEFRHRIEEYLDSGAGECLLKNHGVASLVEDTLLKEHMVTCEIKAWVIMPNHAHVMLKMLPGNDLAGLMKRVKGISARKINQHLNREGSVWHADYFDRYIRDADHYSNVYSYIENNPVISNLASKKEDYRFSSAWHARSGDTPVPIGGSFADSLSGRRSGVHEDRSVLAPFEAELKALVAKDMGKPLAPSKIHFVSGLPKTRNAKVMRRVIRAAYLGEDPGDLSSLEDPSTVEAIKAARD